VQAGQLTGVWEGVVIVHHHDPVVGNGGDALAVARLSIAIKGECQRLGDNSSEDLPRRRAQLKINDQILKIKSLTANSMRCDQIVKKNPRLLAVKIHI
jgi:hypothetical protein